MESPRTTQRPSPVPTRPRSPSGSAACPCHNRRKPGAFERKTRIVERLRRVEAHVPQRARQARYQDAQGLVIDVASQGRRRHGGVLPDSRILACGHRPKDGRDAGIGVAHEVAHACKPHLGVPPLVFEQPQVKLRISPAAHAHVVDYGRLHLGPELRKAPLQLGRKLLGASLEGHSRFRDQLRMVEVHVVLQHDERLDQSLRRSDLGQCLQRVLARVQRSLADVAQQGRNHVVGGGTGRVPAADDVGEVGLMQIAFGGEVPDEVLEHARDAQQVALAFLRVVLPELLHGKVEGLQPRKPPHLLADGALVLVGGKIGVDLDLAAQDGRHPLRFPLEEPVSALLVE